MRAFLKSQGGRVWRSIETGWTEPTKTNVEGEKVAKTFEKYSKEEASLTECNDRALNALFGAVDSSQYRLISNYTEAKKAWEILETTHEGDERVKTAKLQILMTKYENLRMDDKERIAEFHGRVRELANEAENLKRPFTEDSLVLKKKSVKQIAFHSHTTEEEEDDEDPSDGDYQEQLSSLITKQFKKKWMQKKGRTNYQAESSKGFQFRNPRPKESRAPTDDSKRRGPQCFECGGFGHIQSECANNLKKKRQAFVSTWSDEEDDSEEVLGNRNCAFTTQIHDDDPDNLINKLVVLQEEVDSHRRKLDETIQQLEQVEGEKANLKYELTQLKNYQKWMKSAGAEQIENLVDKSRFYGDRTGIGHTLPESSKTPLDLFITRSKIDDEELKEYRRDKKEAVQPTHIHKHILPQRNIDLEDFALKTTLIPMLEARNLLKSVTIPSSYVKQVIQEFFCNIDEDFVNPAAAIFEKVFVRGKLYTFSSTAVNKFLGLDDDQDALVSDVTMWKEITHGVRKIQHPSSKVPSSILNSSYSILLRVAACHWLATSHTNTVTKAMGMLLYKIKNNVSVNLGKLIVAQIAEFGKHNYKQNDNGLPFLVLIFQMLVSQGFTKKDAEKEEPLEPLLQIDNRHFEGKHFNDMVIIEQATHGMQGVHKYLEHKLQQNKEALSLVVQQRKVLEEERKSLLWLQEHVAESAQTASASSQGESTEEEEDNTTDYSA
ncbi:unnamed protein product [Cuscuta campestris]|uniref:CCHC-type domain-containing protein n=1 Tax=Cuscuta campestris TaxID=132261 RepID=A0A484NJS4_9ASTE|nr:unnamed protein product [Cuscuta campestris]